MELRSSPHSKVSFHWQAKCWHTWKPSESPESTLWKLWLWATLQFWSFPTEILLHFQSKTSACCQWNTNSNNNNNKEKSSSSSASANSLRNPIQIKQKKKNLKKKKKPPKFDTGIFGFCKRGKSFCHRIKCDMWVDYTVERGVTVPDRNLPIL